MHRRKSPRGYLHNPELTAEKFIHVVALSEERIYKQETCVGSQTAIWNILGRMDNQVKLRGFRIDWEK
jgi:fengycin family lipopeptide synthetase D/gramicidin S synthase 2/tyrocidine synthetase-2